jgi:hypothetical protein
MPQSQLWVDADACPRVIKEILYRAADRAQVQLTLVANQPLTVPGSRHIRSVQVAGGFDVADSYIVRHAGKGDLVVTAISWTPCAAAAWRPAARHPSAKAIGKPSPMPWTATSPAWNNWGQIIGVRVKTGAPKGAPADGSSVSQISESTVRNPAQTDSIRP